jgi:hypothetical protein
VSRSSQWSSHYHVVSTGLQVLRQRLINLLVIDWNAVDSFCEHRYRDVWDGKWSGEQVGVLRAGALVPLSSPSRSTWYVVTIIDWSSNRTSIPHSSLVESLGNITDASKLVAQVVSVFVFEAFCCRRQGKRENCIVKHDEVPIVMSGVPINGG